MANPLAWLWRKKAAPATSIAAPKEQPEYPDGFFRIVSPFGTKTVGFYCGKCRLRFLDVPVGVPIQHCGRKDTLAPKADLPAVKLTNPTQPSYGGYTFIDPVVIEGEWDGTVGWESSSPGGIGFAR